MQLQKDLRLAYFDLGRIYADQNRNQAAIAAFERAVKLDPSQPDAHYRLARLYTLVGQKQRAAEEFAKTKELHSKTEDSLIQKVSGDAAPAPSSNEGFFESSSYDAREIDRTPIPNE